MVRLVGEVLIVLLILAAVGVAAIPEVHLSANYTNESFYLDKHASDYYIYHFGYNYTNDTVWFGGHSPAYYIGVGVGWTPGYSVEDAYVNASGDAMTGDLNISAMLLVQDDIRAYSGSGYVNITASTGDINLTGNITGIGWDNLLMDWNYLRELPDYIANNYTNDTVYFGGHLPAYYTAAPADGVCNSVNLTTANYNGKVNNGTDVMGYNATNSICFLSFGSGYHMCDEFEIMDCYANHNLDNLDNEDAWIIAGGPKYVPASIPVNDCNGFQYSGTVSYLGNYWHFNKTSGGDGRAINCGTSIEIACCK